MYIGVEVYIFPQSILLLSTLRFVCYTLHHHTVAASLRRTTEKQTKPTTAEHARKQKDPWNAESCMFNGPITEDCPIIQSKRNAQSRRHNLIKQDVHGMGILLTNSQSTAMHVYSGNEVLIPRVVERFKVLAQRNLCLYPHG